MTELTIKGTTSYFAKQEDRPAGAIRSLQEIRDHQFVGEAIIWEVSQNGAITQLKLLETFHAARYDYTDSNSSHFLPAMQLSKKYGDRFTPFFLEQAGIWPYTNKPIPETSNDFQAFFTAQEAIEYSEYLRNTPEYIASVAAYHARCMESLMEF